MEHHVYKGRSQPFVYIESECDQWIAARLAFFVTPSVHNQLITTYAMECGCGGY